MDQFYCGFFLSAAACSDLSRGGEVVGVDFATNFPKIFFFP